MFLKALVASVGLLAVPATAEFRIYTGRQYQLSEGGGLVSYGIAVFNGKPDCGNIKSQSDQVMNAADDASSGVGPGSSFTCDGCDLGENLRDWAPDRLELPHRLEWSEGVEGPITIYWDYDTDQYVVREGDDVVGECDRWKSDEDVHEPECQNVLLNLQYAHTFTCYTDFKHTGYTSG